MSLRVLNALVRAAVLAPLGLLASLGALPAYAQPAVWYADGGSLYQVDAGTRANLRTLPIASSSIAADPVGGVWLVTTGSADRRLQRIGASGAPQADVALPSSYGIAVRVAADPRDAGVWVIGSAQCNSAYPANCLNKLTRFNAAGQPQSSVNITTIGGLIQSAAVARDQTLWVLSEQAVTLVSAQGAVLQSVDLVRPAGSGSSLVVDPLRRVAAYVSTAPAPLPDPLEPPPPPSSERTPTLIDLTVGGAGAQKVLAPSGTPVGFDPRSGALWILGASTLDRYSPTALEASYPLSAGAAVFSGRAGVDPLNGAVWLGYAVTSPAAYGVAIYSSQGAVLGTVAAGGAVAAVSATALVLTPTLSVAVPPAEGLATNNNRPSWVLQYGSNCNGAACELPESRTGAYTLGARLDGNVVTSQFSYDVATRRATFTPAAALTEGLHTLTAEVTDIVGQVTPTVSRAVTVDTLAPTLLALTPPNDSRLTQPALTIAGTFSEPAVIGLGATALQGTSFSYPVTLAPGTNPFNLTATDAAGNTSQTALQFHYLTVSIQAPASGATVASASVVVSGTFSGPAGTAVSVNGVAATLAGTSYSATVPLAVGANSLVASVTSAGVTASTSVSVTRSGDDAPVLVPPPLDPTVPTRIFDSTAFLYTGPNAVQTGVAPGTIEERRVAVVRGKVLDAAGQPMPGVTVSIHQNTQYGQTRSRADGMYDMALNGGGPVTVSYAKAGYLPVHRVAHTPWQDYVVLEDVVMTALDSAVTAVTLGAGQPLQVARGSTVSDTDGTRRATVMFPQGTTASMLLPNGNSQPLTTLNVRATEFTVGPAGPKAMPGMLPPSSGYTYAVELSVDEAIAAGASEVRFTQPVPVYVENFLNFPVGGIVPVGYYDRKAAAWIAAPNGRVIKVLSVDGSGLAVLDTDGDGTPDSQSALDALGITEPERTQLARLYAPATTLWRVRLDHFTPWDCNWPFGPPPNAIRPTSPPPPREPLCPSTVTGSTVECETQALGETIPVTGAPFDLVYRSNRMPGHGQNTLDLVLSGSSVPDSMLRIELEISIAGRTFVQSFPPAPNQRHTFTWDGRDGYGRPVTGAQKAIVSIGYVYAGVYREPQQIARSFAAWGGAIISGSRAANTVTLHQYQTATLGAADVPRANLGGWTASVHHRFDPAEGMLHMGNGHRRSAGSLDGQAGPVITTVAGTGEDGDSGDGGPATAAKLRRPMAIHFDAEGSLYIVDAIHVGIAKVRKVTADGRISTHWNELPGVPRDGSYARFAFTVDSQGNSYYAMTLFDERVIYKVDPTGQRWQRLIGRRASGYDSFDNEGGLASETSLRHPVTALAVDRQGNVYFVESRTFELEGSPWCGLVPDRVRRIDPGGIVTTVIGAPCTARNFIAWEDHFNFGEPSFPPLPAAAPILAEWGSHWPSFGRIESIALDREGNLLVAVSGDGERGGKRRLVARVDRDGIVRRVAGLLWRGHRRSGDGGPALDAALRGGDIATSPNGDLLIAEGYSRLWIPDEDGGGQLLPATSGRVRRVSAGLISTFAGGGLRTPGLGDGGAATSAYLTGTEEYNRYDSTSPSPIVNVAVSPSGDVYISDAIEKRVRKVAAASPASAGSDYLFPSSDGSEVYHFDAAGRHLRTLDGRTRAVLYAFAYNPSGYLASITDAAGNLTAIERDAAGVATAIVSADGQRTTLAHDSNGFLAAVSDAAGQAYAMTYTADGLLTSFRRPQGNTSLITYDSRGRLTRDQNAGGGFWSLTRSELTGDPAAPGFETLLSSAQGRQTLYRIEQLATGEQRRTTVDPAGMQTVTLSGTNASDLVTYPDQTTRRVTRRPGPRFGMLSPLSMTETRLPSGLTMMVENEATATLATATDPLSLVEETRSTRVNGRLFGEHYVAATRQSTFTSAGGRTSIVRTDAAGRPTYEQLAGLEAANYSYDARGRLISLTQGSGAAQRSLTYAYGSDGFVQSITDALTQTVLYRRDLIGRVRQAELPAGRTLELTYDANSNLTSLKPPGRTAHAFGYNGVDRETMYTPPAVPGVADPSTRSEYNLDQQLTRLTRPDGSQLHFGYDAAGRLQTVTPSAGAGAPVTLSYSGSTGQLSRMATADATHDYTYDGYLLIGEAITGSVVGSLGWSYDSDFRVTALVSNGSEIRFAYDADGLLVQAGALSIVRHAQHGLATGSTLGGVSTTQSYNAFGEPESFAADHAGTPVYGLQLGYDVLGRVITKTETVLGSSNTTGYGYDAAGRLATVSLNGTPQASYGWDGNGNRTHIDAAAVATYDAQDRLQSQGTSSYAYTAAGSLATKTTGSGVTSYDYDIHGSLRGVVLPSGGRIDYIVDARQRRIGKKVNGVLTRRWVYQDALRIAAEVDAAGAVVARYVYGERPNVPEYMVKGGVTYRLLSDHLGSVRLVLDAATGAVVQRIDYDEWGRVTSDSNPGFQPFGFAGGLYDADTGLVRFGARDYDAQTGRWTAKDPIGFAGGDANLYAYVEGNPVSLIDPLGLFDVPQGVVDFGAGFGDVITFGLSRHLRDLLDIGSVDRCSRWYTAGEVAGIGATTATGFVGGTRAFARQASPNNWSNFSHSLTPASFQRGSAWSRTGNRANGDYIPTTGTRPDLHDFMDATAAGVAGRYPTWPAWRRLMNRMPYTPGSALYGGASAGMNDCDCSR